MQRDYSRWLTGYCRARGLPVYQLRSLEAWEENTYSHAVLQETLPGWLARRRGQELLRVG